MTKVSGLGDNFYVGGNNLSGDVASLEGIAQPLGLLDVTGINKSAHERLGALADGSMAFTAYFNPTTGQEHKVLSALPRTDVQMMYFNGTSIGNPAAAQIGKQIDYQIKRGNDGSLVANVSAQANGFGLEWGNQLTAGIYTASNSLTGQNSGFEGGIGNWVAVTNNTSTDSSAKFHTGANSLSMSSTASGDMTSASCAAGSIATQGFAVVPGNQVNVQGWVLAAASARTASIGVDWYTSGGSLVSTSYGTGAADNTSTWTLVSATVVAPATAAFARVNTKIAATGAGSEVHYWDDVEYFLLPSSWDSTASLSFGAQAYLQVMSFTGTDATVKIQDSADNVSFSDVTSLAFTQTTAANTTQRISISNTATVRRYIAATVTTSGGFTALAFTVVLVKNASAGVVF